jgi:hypothetical protein
MSAPVWFVTSRNDAKILLNTAVGHYFTVISVDSQRWGVAVYAAGAIVHSQPNLICTCSTRAEADKVLDRMIEKLEAHAI